MNENSVFVGLDCSLTNTGICIFSNCRDPIYHNIKPKEKGIPRLFYIYSAINEVFSGLQQIGGVAIERYAYAKGGSSGSHNSGRSFDLGEGGAAVRLGLYPFKCPVLLIAPPTAKRFATSNGSAGKSVIIKEVLKRWGQDLYDDNLADAYVLARMAYHWFTNDISNLTKLQIDSLKKPELYYDPPVKSRNHIIISK